MKNRNTKAKARSGTSPAARPSATTRQNRPRKETAARARAAKPAPARAKSPRKSPPPPVAAAPRRRGRAVRTILVRGDRVAAVTRLMAETLPLAGYTHVLADCPGKRRPDTIRGIRADHRPNLVCQGGSTMRTVLMDVVLPDEMPMPDIASRWQLFSSAAEQAGGEFHVVVPRWVAGVGAGREAVAKAAEVIGVRVVHVWEV